jgi:hypothetical protein
MVMDGHCSSSPPSRRNFVERPICTLSTTRPHGEIWPILTSKYTNIVIWGRRIYFWDSGVGLFCSSHRADHFHHSVCQTGPRGRFCIGQLHSLVTPPFAVVARKRFLPRAKNRVFLEIRLFQNKADTDIGPSERNIKPPFF